MIYIRGQVPTGLCTACVTIGNEYCQEPVSLGTQHLINRVMAVASLMYQPFSGNTVSPFIDLEKLASEVKRLRQAVIRAKHWVKLTCDRARFAVRKTVEGFCDFVSDSTMLRKINDNMHLLLDGDAVKRAYIEAIGAIYRAFEKLNQLIETLPSSLLRPTIRKLRTTVFNRSGRGGFKRRDSDEPNHPDNTTH